MPTPAALEAEKHALARFAAGPGNWAVPADLFHLELSYGLPFRFRSLLLTARASQVRIALWENYKEGGLRVMERAAELRTLMRETDFMGGRYTWKSWYENSFLFTLEAAVNSLAQHASSPQLLLNHLTDNAERPWTKEIIAKAKRNTQKHVYNLMLSETHQHAKTKWSGGTSQATT